MRAIQVKLYKFDELSDDVKRIILDDWHNNVDYAWADDGLDSIKSFCAEFNVNLTNYSVGAYSHIEFKTDATNRNFRGLKLSSVDKDAMPTGYCVDSDIRYKFYDEFKQTGDALYAFNEAVENGFKSIRADMEYQLSDEAITETIECNDYEFTENGQFA
jgi:hypothetical protein